MHSGIEYFLSVRICDFDVSAPTYRCLKKKRGTKMSQKVIQMHTRHTETETEAKIETETEAEIEAEAETYQL